MHENYAYFTSFKELQTKGYLCNDTLNSLKCEKKNGGFILQRGCNVGCE